MHRMETVNQSGSWSALCSYGYYVFYCVGFYIFFYNNKDLNQGILHFWSKFGDSTLNGLLVIAQTS